jgi:hypothetical protein
MWSANDSKSGHDDVSGNAVLYPPVLLRPRNQICHLASGAREEPAGHLGPKGAQKLPYYHKLPAAEFAISTLAERSRKWLFTAIEESNIQLQDLINCQQAVLLVKLRLRRF